MLIPTPITADEQKQIIRKLAKKYKVKVRFQHLPEASGQFLIPNTIIINKDPSIAWCHLDIFFHELGHVYCYRNKIFKLYHRGNWTNKTLKQVLLTSIKAEKWVDKWAEEKCKEHFPDWTWAPAYKTPEEVQQLSQDIKEHLDKIQSSKTKTRKRK